MQNFNELMSGSNKKKSKQPSMSDFLGINTQNKKVISPFGGGFSKPETERDSKRVPINSKKTRTNYMWEQCKGKCQRCHEPFAHPGMLDIHHKDGDRSNNNEKNLMLVCPKCHRQFTQEQRYKKATKKKCKSNKKNESGFNFNYKI